MPEIITQEVKITTTGGAGVATGSGTTIPVMGFLLDVYLDYHASAPATTDVTTSQANFGNIVVKSNNATDCLLTPRTQICDAAAAAVAAQFVPVPVKGSLTIAVAQANALTDCLVATVRFLSA